ncbi:hypothetical protein EJ08DRAFT_638100 [Tothia fuscella]|uniref:F-box domain-containing protein n=1 Tax=Tothia fuscella TaxID=1048955 RepID=A0A9P4NLA7_9PEZI|nr:hypothetical protein EJ08DRAFT_638100 [Tothia fuscella]
MTNTVNKHSNFLNLFMPMFSGIGKDEYGQKSQIYKPLSFDRLTEGRPVRSNAPIFGLPVELINEILKHVPDRSLSHFALVSWTCCQLARSRQFVSVKFDFSNRTLAIASKLARESLERKNTGKTKQPALGTCIRRISVATNPEWISHRHDFDLQSLADLDPDLKEQKLKRASSEYYDLYLPSLEAIISQGLPHLEAIHWCDTVPMSKSLFTAFVNSQVRELTLLRVFIEEEFTIERSDVSNEQLKIKWPLRHLKLEIRATAFLPNRVSSEPLCKSLLSLCAPTLTHLNWSMGIGQSQLSFEDIDPGQQPIFSALRELRLYSLVLTDNSIPLALMPRTQCRLHTLCVDGRAGPLDAFFQERGTISSLQHLSLSWLSEAEYPLNGYYTFLRTNPQLTKLDLSGPLAAGFIDKRVVPLLKTFNRLKSLCLKWQNQLLQDEFIGSIDERSLHEVGQLSSLEQLHLSTGVQIGWRHNWIIDHEALIKHFSSLSHLKLLAFSRDTYDLEVPEFDADSYYEDKWTNRQIAALTHGRHALTSDEVWEMEHQDRMLTQATKYFADFRKLEWLYFGQLPMIPTGKSRKARPAAKGGRDDCYTYLNTTFGWPYEGS